MYFINLNCLFLTVIVSGLKDQIRKSIEDDHKPLLPMNGEIPVPVKTPATRPKRKRETSGSSCASSTQEEKSFKGRYLTISLLTFLVLLAILLFFS